MSPRGDRSVHLGNYSLLGEIGRGATGVVYLATDSQSGRQVALKVLDPVLSGIAGYPERLRSESEVLSHLTNPHLVATYGMDQDQGHLFLVTEYVEGASLRAVEEKAGRLTPEQSLGIMAGALEGLGLVHAHRLVHGDLKPENIVVDRTGTSKLVDFGQVVSTGSTTLGGTPSYMSPEAARGQALDARSDLYSMGVVLYEALAGRRPFTAANDLAVLRMQAEADPPPIEDLGPHTAALLGLALTKNPDGRPQSAASFIAELESAAAADYGADWKKRAAVAVVAAAVTTGVVELVAPAPAGAATVGGAPTPVGAAAPVGVTAPAAASGGLLATHPVLAALTAAVVVAGLAIGGVAVARGGGAGKATPSSAVAASTHPPSFLAIEKAVCNRTPVAPLPNHHCGIGTAKVSTVDSSWVLIGVFGNYTNQGQLDSDGGEAIYNWKSGLLAGPAPEGFCHPSDTVPGFSSVPVAVLAAWGMSRCDTDASPAASTTPAPATSTAPTSTTTPAPPSGSFAAVTGSWGAHDHWMTVSASGSGSLKYLDFSQCPTCDPGDAPSSTLAFQLTSGGSGPATGTVTASSDPSLYPVGATVKLSLTPSSPSATAEGAPAQTLSVSIGPNPDDQNVPYCAPPDSNNWCGEAIA